MEDNFTPDIRFPSFADNWKRSPLNELCDVFKSGKYIKAEDIYDEGEYPVIGGNGLRGYTSTYNHDGLYVLIGRQGALCGNVNISDGKAYFTEHAIAVKGNETNATTFLYYLLGKMDLGQYSSQSAQPGLAVNNLIKLAPLTPSFAEQKEIGDFFKRLDDKISLHQQELTTLKQTKQGFLQKMFPKEGESVPEIRFPGFDGDWKEIRLGQIAKSFEYGLNASATKYDGENKYIRITDINDETHKFDTVNLTSPDTDLLSAENYLVGVGDILLARTGASVGKSYIYDERDGKVYYAGFLIRARINSNFNADFVFQNTLTSKYNKFIKITSQRSGQPGVNAQEYASFPIMTPSINEQIEIGNFFKRLDNLITLHQKELETLQQTKKAFLQKMFV